MRWILIYLAERLARDPALRVRLRAALNALGQRGGLGRSGDLTIDQAGAGPSWQASRETLPLSRGHGRRARTLIWILGSGLLLLWMLLVGVAYALWVAFGDWAVTQASDISRSAGPSELAGPIASLAGRVRNLVGPTLAVLGITVSAVILIVTALTVRLLSGPTLPR